MANKKKKNNRNNNNSNRNNTAGNVKKNPAVSDIVELEENDLKGMFDFDPEAENVNEEPKTEVKAEPVKEEPKTEAKAEPVKEEPKTEVKAEPVKEEPKTEVKEEPVKEEPVKEEPKAEVKAEPVKEEPKTEVKKESVKEEPKAEAKVELAKEEPQAETAETGEVSVEDMFAGFDDTPAPAPKTIEERMTESQLDALDKLDRDLEKVHRRKEKEQQIEEAKRREKEAAEAERLAKANEVKERQAAAAQRKADMERIKKENPPPPPVVRPVTRTADPMLGAKILQGFVVLLVVIGVAYIFGLIYTRTINDDYIRNIEKELMGIAAAGSSNENDIVFTDGKLSAEEKIEKGLTVFLPDTDEDGLSDYYEINVTKTDPKLADTDGDNIKDGAELRAGLDPLTPNTDNENDIYDLTIRADGALIKIRGKADNASSTLDPVNNNSIKGAPGIVGTPYEFYNPKYIESGTITLSYTDDDLKKWNTDPKNLEVHKFNPSNLSFEKLDGNTLDATAKTVTANISNAGIYAICDKGYMNETYTSRIFFLIDNSGSMYPKEMLENSDENDVEFKRLDFAENLIDKLGTDFDYGAAKFTATYNEVIPLTNDSKAVKEAIEQIRYQDINFDGTEIAQSVINACETLGNDRKYKNYIVLLTDGYPSSSNPEKEAEALEIAKRNNVTIFTIGLGKRISADYLTNMAESTNGQYFQVSNAAALENICDKINSFMNYNTTQITLDVLVDVFILADSGFNVDKDCINYSNFRTDFSKTGTDYGIAEFTRQYYTGDLKLQADGYNTDSGDEITGYDLNSIEQLVDGKPDLVKLDINVLDTYTEYLDLKNKWNYKAANSGQLRYTTNTLDFINEHQMTTVELPYTIQLPELDEWIQTLQRITFQKLPEFSTYECAVINSVIQKDADKDMINVFDHMQHLHLSSEKCKVYDFGYQGEEAYDVLVSELSMGNPVVISLDGAALNACRLLKRSENRNNLVIEAYDCNNRGNLTKIMLTRTPIYDGADQCYYQYSATCDGKKMSLKVYLT